MAMRLVNSRGRSSSLYLVTESMIIFSFQALPLYLDRIFNQYVAIILSVTFVLFFGEVIRQAICTRYGLAVGANFVWLVRILMLIIYPISYPVGKILDCVLGHNDVLFRRPQLKALVSIHCQEVGKAAGAEWKSTSEEEKAPFIEKAKKLKRDYEHQMEAYNRKLVGSTKGEDYNDQLSKLDKFLSLLFCWMEFQALEKRMHRGDCEITNDGICSYATQMEQMLVSRLAPTFRAMVAYRDTS